MSEPAPQARLQFGGAPITSLFAWVVTDADGKEAIARSPWSETAPLVSPDLENVDTTAIVEWLRGYYEPLGITFRLIEFNTTEAAPGPPFLSDVDPAVLEAQADSVVAGVPPPAEPAP